MKPKNFPGRKNRRRIEALERIDPKRKTFSNTTAIEDTQAKIINQDEAEAIRTKKDNRK